MAKKVVLEIDASPIERATHAISEEEKALARLRAATAEHNKAVKASVDVEKANEILQKQTATSYYEKQKVLTALGKVIRSYVANTEEEKARLDELKKQYADLNTELKDFDATMGNHQRNVGNYNESVAKPLTQQLREMQRAMADMIVAGKEGSAEYQAMATEAGRLKDAINDANNEVKRFANDTMVMSDVVDITKSAVGAFGLLQSATALLGVEDENLAKSIQKLQAAQTALASIQQLQQTYLNKSSALYKLLNFNVITYTGTTKAATMATKALNIALKSIGVGFILGAIATIAAHLDDIKNSLSGILPFLKDETKEIEKQKELAEQRAETEKRRVELERELKMLRGESLDIYEKELTAAKNAEQSAKDRYEEEKRNFDARVKARNMSATQEQNALDRLETLKEEYHQKELARIKAENLYNTELANVKKKQTEEDKAIQNEVLSRWVKDGKMRMLQLETEKILQDALIAQDKARAEELKKQLDEIIKINSVIEDEMEEDEDLSWISFSYKDLVELKKEMGTLPTYMQKMLDEYEEKIRDYRNKSVELASASFDLISSIFQANADAIQKNIDAIDKQIDRAEKSINRHQDNISNLYQQAALERGAERDALLAAIDDEKKAMEQKKKEEQKAQEEKDKAEAKQKKEQYKARKVELANQLLQSIANTALAITQSLAKYPLPEGAPMLALNVATGAVSQASIIAQMSKLKMANGGLLHGNSHANGGIPVGNTGIEVEGGEYVVNKRSTAAYLPLLEAINERGRRQYADGGQISLPNIDTTADMLSRIDFNPVVSVVDINRVSDRLNTVRVMSN